MITSYQRIGRPAEAHGARTPADYLARQAHVLAEHARLYPARPVCVPTPCTTPAAGPLISGGRWVVVCACGNAPSYDPTWQLAACCECGAVYTVAPPDGWQEAEALLMARPAMANRHWLPTDQSAAQLAAENAEGLVR